MSDFLQIHISSELLRTICSTQIVLEQVKESLQYQSSASEVVQKINVAMNSIDQICKSDNNRILDN